MLVVATDGNAQHLLLLLLFHTVVFESVDIVATVLVGEATDDNAVSFVPRADGLRVVHSSRSLHRLEIHASTDAPIRMEEIAIAKTRKESATMTTISIAKPIGVVDKVMQTTAHVENEVVSLDALVYRLLLLRRCGGAVGRDLRRGKCAWHESQSNKCF